MEKSFTIEKVKMDEYSGGEECYLIKDNFGHFYAKAYCLIKAHQIASSHLLLEALKNLMKASLRVAEGFDIPGNTTLRPLVYDAMDAIKKSEGK